MKKFIIILLLITTLGTLTGCLRQPTYDPIKDVLDTLSVRSETQDSFDIILLKDNVELTWTSSDSSIVIDYDKAVVTQGKVDTNVVLTVKAVKGELEGEKTFNVKVLRDVNFPNTVSIAESYLENDNQFVKYLDVTVLESSSIGTYFTDDINVIFADIKNLEKNGTYEVVGMKVTKDIPMLENVVVTAISSTVKTLNASTNTINFNANGYYEVSGLLNIKDNDLYLDNIKVNSSNLNTLKLFVDKEVTMNVFISENNEVITYADETNLNLANDEILEVISNQLTLVEYTKYDLNLMTTYLLGSTINWTSDNEAINKNGTVTREGDDVVVKLIASINYKTESISKEFNVTVIDKDNNYLDELFISEYYEGISNNKYIEIYNPTDMVIDLTDYSLKLGVNGAKFKTTCNLETEILPNETVLVIHTSMDSSIVDILDANSINYFEHSVTNFNGDDAIGLFKDDILIDIFGIEGVDPGTHWEVGAGNTVDHKITRNKTTGANTTWDTTEWYCIAITDNLPQLTNIGIHSFI